jgi:4-hydroxyproline epimerase
MTDTLFQRISVIDSHTGGEPTRLVIAGGPDLGSGPLTERVKVFRERFDWFRSTVNNEPRGSDVIVGALLCEPADPTCTAAIIFFDNVGMIGMCGHGTIGIAVSLAYLGKLTPGRHRFETPVGVVTAMLEGPNQVTVENVTSYRLAKDVDVPVPGLGRIRGDVAWGGNWFFLTEEHGQKLELARTEQLTDEAWRIRLALRLAGISGRDGAEIEHVGLFGPPTSARAHSKNFILCPGKAYDRSPCGTGTSAKMACLAADGKLGEGDVWRQESIVGSIFEGSVRIGDSQVQPRIRGSAYVMAEATLLLDPNDPFRTGIHA